jgi:hypothetical protein
MQKNGQLLCNSQYCLLGCVDALPLSLAPLVADVQQPAIQLAEPPRCLLSQVLLLVGLLRPAPVDPSAVARAPGLARRVVPAGCVPHRAIEDADAACGRLWKLPSFWSAFPMFFRACLGKSIIFGIKGSKEGVFRTSTCTADGSAGPPERTETEAMFESAFKMHRFTKTGSGQNRLPFFLTSFVRS